MYVFIEKLYGGSIGGKSYYRKLGDCFDFVNVKECASNISKDESEKIMKYADYYKKMYGATIIGIED